jgi:uncharacterized membrane protein
MANSLPLWLARWSAVEGAPRPRSVPFDAPWAWLAAGWRDVWAMPQVSIAYGAFFTAAAALLAVGLWVVGAPSLFLALAGGFLLLGPFVAVGLYEASRRLAGGEEPSLSEVVTAGLAARGELAFFGAILAFAFFVWLQIAFLLLMLFLGTSEVPPASTFMHTLLFTPRGLGLLIVGSIIGGLIAVVIFAISAVAVPMLLEKEIDAVTAARASIAAAVHNPKSMALWAALIVVIMGAGFATLLVGLAISFPLIGHATWHAYADIYGSRREP